MSYAIPRPASWSSAKEALQRRCKSPILLDQMDADAANSARLEVTTPRCWSQHQCERTFHARRGSLQDAPSLVARTLGNLAWSSKHPVQWKNKQQTKTPRPPDPDLSSPVCPDDHSGQDRICVIAQMANRSLKTVRFSPNNRHIGLKTLQRTNHHHHNQQHPLPAAIALAGADRLGKFPAATGMDGEKALGLTWRTV
jgi:hypothetical protein